MSDLKYSGHETAYICLLGGFELSIGGTLITDELNRCNKLWNALTYLIAHRHRAISQPELIDVLWPGETDICPAGALKTLFFRIRKMLAPVFGEDRALILSRAGSYAWNESIECVVDIELLEQLCRDAADQTLDLEFRAGLYRQIVALYRGDFLPKLASRDWTVPLRIHCRTIYLDAVRQFAAILLKEERYEEMAAVCLKAIQIDQYDEGIHMLLLESLLAQGKNAAALNHYERTTDFLYRSLGVSPSSEMRGYYEQIMREQHSREADLAAIQSTLSEPHQTGAFVCELGFFKQAYQLAARMSQRTGECVHVLLLTLSGKNGEPYDHASLCRAMDALLADLRENLRASDVISKYSGSQYLALLPNADYDAGILAAERISAAFSKHYRCRGWRLTCRVRPVGKESELVLT